MCLSLSLLLFLSFSDDTFSSPPLRPSPGTGASCSGTSATARAPCASGRSSSSARAPSSSWWRPRDPSSECELPAPTHPTQAFPQADLPSFHFSRHHPGLRGRTRSLRPRRARRRESMQPRGGYSTRRILAPGPPIALRGWPQDPPGGPTRVPSPSTTRRRPPRRGGGPAPAASRLSRRILGRYSGPGRARSEARSSGTGSFFLPAFAFATCNTI